jgi:hypothetical protein
VRRRVLIFKKKNTKIRELVKNNQKYSSPLRGEAR